MPENVKKIIKYLGTVCTVIMNLFYPGVIICCIFPEKFPSDPVETVLALYSVFTLGWAFFATVLAGIYALALKSLQASVDQLRNSPKFKDVQEAPKTTVSVYALYHIMAASSSALCLIAFKSFYFTGGSVLYSLAVLNIGGILTERKRSSLALKYEANKEIADAELERYRETGAKKKKGTV